MERRVSWRHVALLALGACAANVTDGAAASHRVSLRTDDGVTLAATWYEPSPRGGPAVVLVHMLHRSRRDWDGVASRLAAEGIGALAIDLRGHGESQGSAAVDDLSRMALDVRAARRFLGSRSDTHGPVGLAGASLGASLAALEASTDSTIASVVLLSPSLEYRGLRIEAALRKYGGRPALLVAGDDDAYAARSVRELQKAGDGTREMLLLSRAGHGTTMLSRDPELTRRLVDWFRRTLL
ncbi:MAG: alpha/beta fold hydrolase [Acidobacteria bacterium]|nr:alpha/beta fold hydrolase [Acidobacteriota bacterium]MCA1649370.1 alpha/beta fold hydrolase [Acidobacteriota bacterium]